MATAGNQNTIASDDDGDDRAASSSGAPADPYRYTSISQDGRTVEELHDAGEVSADMRDTPDSASLARRQQRLPDHHIGVGVNAVVDSTG
jgi:hypothetical protein